MRLLCISDIHGRADALAAVLATAERRGYDKLLVAGDLCFPGPEPLETFRRLTQAGAICVQGTGDRALATLDLGTVRARSEHERARLDRLTAVRREIGELILTRLARLPLTYRLPLDDGSELLLVHGSPADPMEPLTHDMSDEEIDALLGDDPADIVICGGSHVPFDRVVSGVRVINVGSVGEAPSGSHIGNQHADATIIEIRGGFPAKHESPPRGPAAAGGAIDAPGFEVLVEQLVVPLGKAA
ncbi:MAG: metallophosphoesterase family protein [Byssovorax sp.]